MPRTSPPSQAPDVPGEAFGIIASASPVGKTSTLPQQMRVKEDWQVEVLDMLETVGPLRYAANWFSNALSRAKLFPAEQTPTGIKEQTTGPEYDALQELFDGSEGSQALLKAMGMHYFTTGEWYLVGRGAGVTEGKVGSPTDKWEVVSVEEIQKRTDSKWVLKMSDDGSEDIELADDDAVIRMWSPSARKRWKADSPAKAALPDLREVRLYSRHISAQVYSRLLGAGILFLPQEITFTKPTNSTVPTNATADPSVDKFMVDLGETIMAAVKDPGSVAAYVPIVVKAPGEHIDKIKHMTFWTPLDEKAIEMRKDSIRNLATTLDMPPEVLLGTADVNHWGSWQIDESAIKTHLEPALLVIATAIAVGFLRAVTGNPKAMVGVDTAALRMRPNRSKEAVELYDRGELNGAALRRETGFEEDDGWGADSEGYNAWVLKKVATGSATPEMVVEAIRLITGIALPTPESTDNRQSRPDPSLVDHPDQGPPADDGEGTASLMATCEAMTYRVLERCGNRIKNRTTSRPPGIEAADLYRHIAVKSGDLDTLLKGAWDPLPNLLHRTSYDAVMVSAALDAYVRSLLMTQAKYDPDAMQRHVFIALGIG